MTSWNLVCAVYFAGELVILGPKCQTADCLEPARFRVLWPGRMVRCCARCTDGWRQIAARGLGFELATQPLYYTTGEDDAVQRFRNLELT